MARWQWQKNVVDLKKNTSLSQPKQIIIFHAQPETKLVGNDEWAVQPQSEYVGTESSTIASNYDDKSTDLFQVKTAPSEDGLDELVKAP